MGDNGGGDGGVNQQYQRAAGAKDNLDRYIEGGAQAINGIGRYFAQGNQMSQSNPINKFTNMLGSAFRGVGNAFGVATAPMRASSQQQQPQNQNPYFGRQSFSVGALGDGY